MKVTFWGTRGSIPKPGKKTLRYGGNTSCVEVVTNSGQRLILDCGSGAHDLGIQLMSDGKSYLCGTFLFSHTHWDHIQGAPFFTPFYIPGAKWDIFGPQSLNQTIKRMLSGQMDHTYFPLSLNELKAALTFYNLTEGEFTLGDARIVTHFLNHTVLTLGYRIEADGVSIVYSCDHEPFLHSLAGGKGKISGPDSHYLDFISGADLLIHDAQYSAEEYTGKIGWGHSTPDYVLRLAEEGGVKEVILTHHDPIRCDEQLDIVEHQLKEQIEKTKSKLRLSLAKEGLILNLKPASVEPDSFTISLTDFSHKRGVNSAISSEFIRGGSVLLYGLETTSRSILVNAVEKEGLQPIVASTEEMLHSFLKRFNFSLIIIGSDDAEAAIKLIDGDLFVPLLLVATSNGSIDDYRDLFSDWLIHPFTESLARAKIVTWILRSSCKKERVSTLGINGKQVKLSDCVSQFDALQSRKLARIRELALGRI